MTFHKAIQKTFAIIKPDAVKKGLTLDVLTYLSAQGFKITKLMYRALTLDEINELYVEHSAKHFFGEIRDFMSSHPVVLLVLEREDAITHLRVVMGATNSADADHGTIRNLYGDKTMKMYNVIHGSDSEASAKREMKIFNLLDIKTSCC